MKEENSSPAKLYQSKDMAVRSSDPYAIMKYEIILDWLSSHPPLKILNVGCGSGEFCQLLVNKGHKVTGLDHNEEYIRMAKEKAALLGLRNYKFESSDIENYSCNELFDAVIATDVIEHIEDDNKALAKMVSLIKPNGLLVITVPEGRWLYGYHDKMMGHYRRYSYYGLLKLLRNYVQLKKIRSFGFFLIPVCVFYSKIMRKHYPVLEVGNQTKQSLAAKILSLIFYIEKKIPFPLGTSLLAMGQVQAMSSRARK